MTEWNKIVRVREIYKDVYKIYLTTFEEYSGKVKYKAPEYKFELKPYKWYEINCLWEVPSYWIQLRLAKSLNNKRILENSLIARTIKIIMATSESILIIWGMIELVNKIICYYNKTVA